MALSMAFLKFCMFSNIDLVHMIQRAENSCICLKQPSCVAFVRVAFLRAISSDSSGCCFQHCAVGGSISQHTKKNNTQTDPPLHNTFSSITWLHTKCFYLVGPSPSVQACPALQKKSMDYVTHPNHSAIHKLIAPFSIGDAGPDISG